MLNGDKVVLRPVRERDLAAFIDSHTEISNRGEFFRHPAGASSPANLRRDGVLGAGCGHPAHLEPGRRHGRPHFHSNNFTHSTNQTVRGRRLQRWRFIRRPPRR
jgi:hypothetical protein